MLSLLGLAPTAGPAAGGCDLIKLAELPVTMKGASPLIPAKINGADVELVADSGAFFNMITPDSAAKFKLQLRALPPDLIVVGVTGQANVGLARADELDVAGTQFKNAEFLVGDPQLQAYANGMIGQNLLNLNDAEYDLANGVIRLFKPIGCDKAILAYWAQTKPFAVIPIASATTTGRRQIEGSATVNGARIRAVFDTGAPRSMLTLAAARRAGVTPQSPGAVPAGATGGVGRRSVKTWIAPFSSFGVGDEEVRNTRLRIGDIELSGADMLLGADFFLAHRIFVANSQHKLYLTYNGGPVFNLDQADDAPPPESPQPAAPSAATVAAADTSEPTDAGGFIRRAAAFVARGDRKDAIADYTRAARLSPNNPEPYYERAKVELADGQPQAGMMDLDRSLKLKPNDLDALMARGFLRLSMKREVDARADFDVAERMEPKIALAIANVYADAGLFEAAIGKQDRWIEAHPKDDDLAVNLNNRCWTRALWGRELDKALADCDAAIKLRRGEGGFYDSRGLVHLRLGQFDEAIADYDSALRRRPGQAWSLYGRGLAERRKGQTVEGDADIQAASKLAPGLPEKAKTYGLSP